MKTKIKKKSPNKSPYPDNSSERSFYEKGFRDAVNKMQMRIDECEVNGMQKALVMILYILKSKYNAPDDELIQFRKDIDEYAGLVNKGFLTVEILKNELQNVYDVQF